MTSDDIVTLYILFYCIIVDRCHKKLDDIESSFMTYVIILHNTIDPVYIHMLLRSGIMYIYIVFDKIFSDIV